MNYHVEMGSIYVQIVRVKYQNDKYMKCHIKYFAKSSGQLISEERNRKLMKSVFKFWEVYEN